MPRRRMFTTTHMAETSEFSVMCAHRRSRGGITTTEGSRRRATTSRREN